MYDEYNIFYNNHYFIYKFLLSLIFVLFITELKEFQEIKWNTRSLHVSLQTDACVSLVKVMLIIHVLITSLINA